MHVSVSQVEIRKNRHGQDRAYVAGSRVRVIDVFALAEREGLTPDLILSAFPALTLGQVHMALAYAFDHRDEIVRQLKEEQAIAIQSRDVTGPGPMERALQQNRPDDDPVSL